MMLVDGKIIENDRVSSQRVFGKLGNVIGSYQNFRKSLPKDMNTGGSLSHREHDKRLVRILINIWIFF